MDTITTTPFGQRPVSAVLIKHTQQAQHAPCVSTIDKWTLFHDLCAARRDFGLSNRELTVLNALLSFHVGKTLSEADNLVVFPSNRTLAERAHGMAESTLRRHLATLVHTGLIQRHDSPNGKRYAARGAGGQILRAFGFDLRPLLVRAPEIVTAAQEARQHAEHLRRLREDVSLLKRDALKLFDYGQQTAAFDSAGPTAATLQELHKQSRRKLCSDALLLLRDAFRAVLGTIRAALETPEMSGNPPQNERHYQNSHKDISDVESAKEEDSTPQQGQEINATSDEKDNTPEPSIPLGLVLKACPDIVMYTQGGVRNWHELIAAAGFVRGMMGISLDAWQQASAKMGAQQAAITVAAMLQRINDIKCPGGYLRSLSKKAAEAAFSPTPMVMALLNARTS